MRLKTAGTRIEQMEQRVEERVSEQMEPKRSGQ